MVTLMSLQWLHLTLTLSSVVRQRLLVDVMQLSCTYLVTVRLFCSLGAPVLMGWNGDIFTLWLRGLSFVYV